MIYGDWPRMNVDAFVEQTGPGANRPTAPPSTLESAGLVHFNPFNRRPVKQVHFTPH
jgi:hypothetical protein